jgi:myo-inositol-1(or 4)-monophosphatase
LDQPNSQTDFGFTISTFMSLSKEQLSEVLQLAKTAVQQAGDYINSQFGIVNILHADEKSLNSLVSIVDKTAEEMLVKSLGAILPEAGFITEESTTFQERKTLSWIIDPLDGTTNFLFGVPVISVSVALKENEETVLGIVLDITRGQMFNAIRGGGAFNNNIPIQVSQRKVLSDALIATGFPYHADYRLGGQLKMVEYFVRNTRGVRRLGSAALDLAYVSCGIFDVYFEYHLNEWDTAAGMLLVREAGGICSDMQGNLSYETGQEVIAGNAYLHDTALNIIQSMQSQISLLVD